MRPRTVPSASFGRNGRTASSPFRFPSAKARRRRSPPASPCWGRKALPTFVNGREECGRADVLAGLRSVGAQVSPSATSRVTNGLALAGPREPPRASRAGGLPLGFAPKALRPALALPLAPERPSGMPRVAGFCRTAFRSKRRTTSARLSSCPRFSSLRVCASSASSLRLISCHLSGISTFRWSTRVGAAHSVRSDRPYQTHLATLSGTRDAGSGAALASVASCTAPFAL
jgi:hypothetical protein